MKQKGITLIALVITIIVLLILTAVTIATLTGENGLLTKASNAKEETSKETATEKINLKITSAQMKSYAETQSMPDLQYLANTFCENESGDIEYVHDYPSTGIESIAKIASSKESNLPYIKVEDAIYTKLAAYPYEFKIDSSLRLASIDGVKVSDNSNTEIDNTSLTWTELARSDKAGSVTVEDIDIDNYKYVQIVLETNGNYRVYRRIDTNTTIQRWF